jgi:hypothetical protein
MAKKRLNRQDFEEVLAFGKRHARKRGLKPRDVVGAIAAVRSRKRAGPHLKTAEP